MRRFMDAGLMFCIVFRKFSPNREYNSMLIMRLSSSGQNPTGCTLSIERRKQIYALAQRFDLMIIEDGQCFIIVRFDQVADDMTDPYYYLQYDIEESSSNSLMPSFLSMDVDGRVLRVDSFSKVMMPGMRLGWITSSQLFHEHLISLNDNSTQHPHGFGQIFITEMLSEYGWGMDGFDRWVRSLRKQYQRRRDMFVEYFHQEVESTGLASAELPQAGMFVWIDIHIRKHPRYRADIRDAEGSVARTNVPELMDELFENCLDAGLVVMPASVFAAPPSVAASKLLGEENSIQNVSLFCQPCFVQSG